MSVGRGAHALTLAQCRTSRAVWSMAFHFWPRMEEMPVMLASGFSCLAMARFCLLVTAAVKAHVRVSDAHATAAPSTQALTRTT